MKDNNTAARSILWMARYPRFILVIITLACLLPFADKAFHIDDSLFVWAGRHMQTQWWDPYGFEVNWYGWTMPMHEVTKNPPLACAYIALISSIFGENEFALHLGFFAQAIAVVLGTYELARRLCDRPFQAALAALFTPVFLVSSTTVMCDVLMVALWVWAVVVWMRGLENNQPLTLALAGLLVGACVMAKYFGIAPDSAFFWLILLAGNAELVGGFFTFSFPSSSFYSTSTGLAPYMAAGYCSTLLVIRTRWKLARSAVCSLRHSQRLASLEAVVLSFWF